MGEYNRIARHRYDDWMTCNWCGRSFDYHECGKGHYFRKYKSYYDIPPNTNYTWTPRFFCSDNCMYDHIDRSGEVIVHSEDGLTCEDRDEMKEIKEQERRKQYNEEIKRNSRYDFTIRYGVYDFINLKKSSFYISGRQNGNLHLEPQNVYKKIETYLNGKVLFNINFECNDLNLKYDYFNELKPYYYPKLIRTIKENYHKVNTKSIIHFKFFDKPFTIDLLEKLSSENFSIIYNKIKSNIIIIKVENATLYFSYLDYKMKTKLINDSKPLEYLIKRIVIDKIIINKVDCVDLYEPIAIYDHTEED